MSDDTPIVPAEPFWTSKVFIGLAIAIASQLAVAFPKLFAWIGWTDPAKIHSGVEGVCGAVALAATGYAMWKRWRNKTAPLTVNRKQADAHPNTVAYEASAAQNPLPTLPPELPK